MVRLLSALVLLLAVPAVARAAAPGTPDASFAGDGVATKLYPGQFAEGKAVVSTPGPLAVVGDLATTLATPGATVVAGFGSNGTPSSSFGSTTGWPTASPYVAGAVREASGRIVAVRGGTPGNAYPSRTELVGYDANGQLDSTFGAGGRRLLSTPGLPTRILLAPGGGLLVVGSGGGTSTTPDTDVVLTRVSANGTELGHASIPVSGSDLLNVSAAVVDAAGGVIVAGTNPDAFLVRFTPAGAPDAAYGTKHPPLGGVQIDDMALDASGRLLVAGATIGDFGRSVGVPLKPLLRRMSTDGVIDPTFAAVGRGAGSPQSELTGVRQGGAGRVYASVDSGEIMRFSGAGRPDLSFGEAGVSPLPATRIFALKGLTLAAPNVYVTGQGPIGDTQTRMAVERVRVTGSGIPPSKRHYAVQVRRLSGIVAVRPAAGTADQRLRGRMGALLYGRHLDGGDGFFYTPPAVEVTARRGLVRAAGVAGRAEVRGGRFTLRDAPRGRVMELAFFPPASCARGETVTVAMHGPFRLRAGGRLISNRTHVAKIRMRLRCGAPPQVVILRGSIRVV